MDGYRRNKPQAFIEFLTYYFINKSLLTDNINSKWSELFLFSLLTCNQKTLVPHESTFLRKRTELSSKDDTRLTFFSLFFHRERKEIKIRKEVYSNFKFTEYLSNISNIISIRVVRFLWNAVWWFFLHF